MWLLCLLLVGGSNFVAVGWVVCATFFVVCSFSRFLWDFWELEALKAFALYFRVRFLCGTVFCGRDNPTVNGITRRAISRVRAVNCYGTC